MCEWANVECLGVMGGMGMVGTMGFSGHYGL